MHEIPHGLTDDRESPAPAEPFWVYTVLSDGLYFPPPDPAAPNDHPEYPDAVYTWVAIGVMVVLLILLVIEHLT